MCVRFSDTQFTFFALVIFSASAGGFLAPVSVPAAERTAKINTPCIPRMGKKQYVAVPASRKAFSQVRLVFKNKADNPIVLRNNTTDLFSTVPVTNELKTRLYPYYKKAKCSLISLMYLGMPSLCPFYLAIN